MICSFLDMWRTWTLKIRNVRIFNNSDWRCCHQVVLWAHFCEYMRQTWPAQSYLSLAVFFPKLHMRAFERSVLFRIQSSLHLICYAPSSFGNFWHWLVLRMYIMRNLICNLLLAFGEWNMVRKLAHIWKAIQRYVWSSQSSLCTTA